jgi:hypothetical protein
MTRRSERDKRARDREAGIPEYSGMRPKATGSRRRLAVDSSADGEGEAEGEDEAEAEAEPEGEEEEQQQEQEDEDDDEEDEEDEAQCEECSGEEEEVDWAEQADRTEKQLRGLLAATDDVHPDDDACIEYVKQRRDLSDQEKTEVFALLLEHVVKAPPVTDSVYEPQQPESEERLEREMDDEA